MKKSGFLLFGLMLLFSSCSIHQGLTTNVNNHNTEVVLSKNNFKVIAAVNGKSKTTRVFGIGGISKNALIANAKVKMLENANFIGGSRAIINETVELKHSFYFIVSKSCVSVSANVIEFTE